MEREIEVVKNKPKKYPCKDCEKRHAGCHADCAAYLEARERNQAANAEERKSIEEKLSYIRYKLDQIEKSKKRRKKPTNNKVQ